MGNAAKKTRQTKKAETEDRPTADSLRDFSKAFTISVQTLEKEMRTLVADSRGIKIKAVTDKMVGEALNALHKSGSLDKTFRDMGIVPKPGWWSAITQWHNIEHMRTNGITNKVCGAVGMAYQAAAVILAAYIGYDRYGRA